MSREPHGRAGLEGFARLCAELDAPFARRADALGRAGLDEATFAALAVSWGAWLVANPGSVDGFAAAYAGAGMEAALVCEPTARAPAAVEEREAPRAVEVPSFALVAPGTQVQETREIDRVALQRLVTPFRPGPARLPEGQSPALPASDGETLPMPAAGLTATPVARGLLTWREHARLRAALDAAPMRVAEVLPAAGVDPVTFAAEEQAWRERLARDPVLRTQWRAAYEHAAAGG